MDAARGLLPRLGLPTCPGSTEVDGAQPAPAHQSTGPRDASGWARWTTPGVTLPVVAAVLAVALALVLVDRGERGPGAGEAIVEVTGRARVRRAGHTGAETVTGRSRLGPGDHFDLRAGRARFQLADGLRYEAMGPSSHVAGTSLVMAVTPMLRSGRLLVEAGRVDASVRAGSARVEVPVGGAARLGRSYAVRVGSYRGSAQLSSAGRVRRIGALRSADAAGPGEVGPARPLSYQAGDPWDRRFLGDAIYLDGQLAPLVKGIEASGIGAPALVDAVRRQLPRAPSVAAVARLIGRAPSRVDQGIGLAVVGSGRDHGFGQRWRRAVSDRRQGMPWGLVAMQLGADPVEVIAVLGRALDSRALTAFPDLGDNRSAVLAAPAGTAGPAGVEVGPATLDTGVSGVPGDPGTAVTPGLPGTVQSVAPGSASAGAVTPPNSSGNAAPAPAIGGGTDPTQPTGTPTSPGSGGTGAGTSSGTADGTGGGGKGGGGTTVTSPAGGLTVTPPPVTQPPVTVPRVTLPPVTVPSVTVPPVTLPKVTVPAVTVPRLVVPTVTVPASTVPLVDSALGGGTGLLGH